MIGRTNAEIPGSDNVTTVTLLSGDSGVTITATGAGKTKNAVTDANGMATFRHLEIGYTWTFTDGTFSESVAIDSLSESVVLGKITIALMVKISTSSGGVHLRPYVGENEYADPIWTYNGSPSSWTSAGNIEVLPNQEYIFTMKDNRLISRGYSGLYADSSKNTALHSGVDTHYVKFTPNSSYATQYLQMQDD